MAAIVNVRVYKGEDVSLTVTMIPQPTAILGWTFAFTLKRLESDSVALLALTNSAFTILDAVNGIFRCLIAAANLTTIAVGVYKYDVWRVDAGSATCIVLGYFDLEPSPRGGV